MSTSDPSHGWCRPPQGGEGRSPSGGALMLRCAPRLDNEAGGAAGERVELLAEAAGGAGLREEEVAGRSTAFRVGAPCNGNALACEWMSGTR